MELRRHKDILAVKVGKSRPVALHARNLQVAELSEEAWQDLQSTSLSSGLLIKSDLQKASIQDLELWNNLDDDSVTEDSSEFGIRSLTLNVTQICNLHCTYCAAGGDGTYGDPVKKISVEKTLPQIRFFLEQMKPGQNFHIAFLGGEPLLYPEALRLIAEYTRDEAASRGLSASFKVTTNGTLINDSALKILTDLKMSVVVSVDGPQETHDLQRLQKNGQGSFTLVEDGLKKLIAVREKLNGLGVHAVFNEKNLDVEKAWDFFAPMDVDFMEFTYSVNHPDSVATRRYNESLERALAKAWAKGGEQELLRIVGIHSIFSRLDRQARRTNHCGLGKSMLVVDSRNRLWSCPWTIGQAEDRLGEGTDLNYDRLALHQKSQIEVNKCENCWARFLCGGGCSFIHQSTGGDLKGKKVDFCERTRFLMGLALVYYHQARGTEETAI